MTNLPDSDNSTFLGFGAGEGDSLFSILLCLGAKRQKLADKSKKKLNMTVN